MLNIPQTSSLVFATILLFQHFYDFGFPAFSFISFLRPLHISSLHWPVFAAKIEKIPFFYALSGGQKFQMNNARTSRLILFVFEHCI